MKKILALAVILLCLGLFLMWVEVFRLEKERDSLKIENKALKTKERYSISIGDTTLQIVRKLKIGQENGKVLDVRTIHKGKNIYYLELNEITELDLVIMKY